jgi:iron complex outermembrane recepter protein
MKYVKFLIPCLIQLYSTLSYGNDDKIIVAGLSEDDFLTEIPQVLTISRLRQSASDAPTASTIIDRKTIEAAGIIDLPEVFRLVPGFYVGVNAGFITNTNHVVSYHGLSDAYARRMQVLIDGRTVYQPLYGGVQWSELPITINDIERIEITRGPNAASYGANAFLGVINIITREPTGEKNNTIEVNHGNGRNEAFYHHSGELNSLDYRVSAGYKEDEGLDTRDDYKRTNLLNFRGHYTLSNNDNLEFQFGYAEGKREEGNLEEDPYLMLPRTKDVYNHFELIKWNKQLNDDNSFYVQGYHAYDKSNDSFTSADLSVLLSPAISPGRIHYNNDMSFERYDIEAQQNIDFNQHLRMAWGGSLRLDKLYAPFWIGSNRTDNFKLQRLFSQLEWAANNKVTFNAGFMLEHNSFTGTDASPRVSANVKITPNQTIRLGFSQANRTPSYLEEKFRGSVIATTTIPGTTLLYQRFYDLGNLEPEKISSTEIGYIAELSSLSIDAKIFHDKITNYITDFVDESFVAPAGYTLLPDSDGDPTYPRTFTNQGTVFVRGFETQLKWSISENTKLIGNYARISLASENVSKGDKRDIQESTPRDTSSLLLMHQFKSNWSGSLAAYYTTPVRAFGDGNDIDTNYRLDARLAKKFQLNKTNGEVSINVQNITDRHDKEFSKYNELRRRAFVNVKLDF